MVVHAEEKDGIELSRNLSSCEMVNITSQVMESRALGNAASSEQLSIPLSSNFLGNRKHTSIFYRMKATRMLYTLEDIQPPCSERFSSLSEKPVHHKL